MRFAVKRYRPLALNLHNFRDERPNKRSARFVFFFSRQNVKKKKGLADEIGIEKRK